MKKLKNISNLNSDDKILQESWMYIKTDVMAMSEALVEQANGIESRFKKRTEKLEDHIKELEKRVNKLSKRKQGSVLNM